MISTRDNPKALPAAEVFDYEHCLDRYQEGYTALFVRGLARREGWSMSWARTVFVDAMRFLLLCARNPGVAFVCSPTVDKAIDYFILDTAVFRWFGQEIAKATIDHLPAHEIDPVESERKAEYYRWTVKAMQEAAHTLDERIWPQAVNGPNHCVVQTDEDCVFRGSALSSTA